MLLGAHFSHFLDFAQINADKFAVKMTKGEMVKKNL